MLDNISLVLLSASAVSALVGLYQLARLQSTEHRTLIYAFRASLAIFVLGVVFSSLEGTYFWEIFILPAGTLLFAQIALIVFREPDKARRPAALLILAAIVLGVTQQPDQLLSLAGLLDVTQFLSQFIGIGPLMASTFLLMKEGRTHGGWLGLVTSVLAVPVFVQRYPVAWPAARRFLFWFVFTFGLVFVTFTAREPDKLFTVGYLVFSVGGLSAMAAFLWLMVTLTRRAWSAAVRPALTFVAAAAVATSGILMFGNLFDRRSATVAARTVAERAFGCAGTAQHAALLTAWSTKPMEILLVRLPLAIGAVTDDYDPVLALQLAQASTLAYLSPCEMLDHTRQWQIAGLSVLPRGTVRAIDSGRECGERTDREQAVILADERNVIVAFRGTDQRADVMTDLSFFPTSMFEKEWKHGGFATALERQWPWLLKTMQRVRDRNQAVWLTGHSLGGALAVLAADRLVRSDIPVEGVYTFGQPLVGSQAFAGTLNVKGYYRFVMNGDLVPALGTPRSADSGNLRYIDTLGQIHSRPTRRVDATDGLCRLFGPLQSHSMIHYLSTLQLSLLKTRRLATSDSVLRN